MPIPLGAIEESSKQCLELAEEVEKEFYIVSQTLGELLEASTAAKGETLFLVSLILSIELKKLSPKCKNLPLTLCFNYVNSVVGQTIQ